MWTSEKHLTQLIITACGKSWFNSEEVGHKSQTSELVNESLLVVVMAHRSWSEPNPQPKLNSIAENTGFSVLNWIRNVIYCALNYIPEPIKHTKLVFSAILLSFGRGSGWDQLLYVITELPASFLWPAPRFDPLCMKHAMSNLLWVQLGISQLWQSCSQCTQKPCQGLNCQIMRSQPSSVVKWEWGKAAIWPHFCSSMIFWRYVSLSSFRLKVHSNSHCRCSRISSSSPV